MKLKGNLTPWLMLLTVQFLLAFGLSMFWYYEGEILRNPTARALAETAEIKSKNVTDREALGIIAGQQIRIQGLLIDRTSARRYAGYMALLSIACLAIAFGIMVGTVFERHGATPTDGS